VPKIAAAVLVVVCLSLFSIPMSAQLIPHGNVYAGVSYGQSPYVIPPSQSYRGWNGSGEAIPFARYTHIGFVLDLSGFYRSGLTQYNAFLGPRLSGTYGKWRPFVHAMGGIQRVTSSGGNKYNPVALDFGGGTDYKLPFKNFSWRVQADYMHTHYAAANQSGYRASTGIVWRF
jgi:hypothetical protein